MNPWEIDMADTAIRLVMALVLGGMIGLEREQNNHAAGFRTHILVCIGSALIMMLSIYGFADFVNEPNVRMDPARLAAQVVSGIGFLGAGVILRNGFSVMGLTTAASLWVVAAIGLAVGAGFYFAAGISTVIVIFSLWLLNKIELRFIKRIEPRQVIIQMKDSARSLSEISELCETRGAEVRNIRVSQSYDEKERPDDWFTLEMSIKMKKSKKILKLIEEIRRIEGVYEINVE